MWENIKIIISLIGIVIVFWLVAPFLLNFTGSLTSKPRVLVEYPTAVQGRITGSEVKRQHHLYYLNGNTEQYYDFNRFAQPLTPSQQRMDEEEQHMLGLGRRLEPGDIISKAANSTMLTVQRGDSISRWFCSIKILSD